MRRRGSLLRLSLIEAFDAAALHRISAMERCKDKSDAYAVPFWIN